MYQPKSKWKYVRREFLFSMLILQPFTPDTTSGVNGYDRLMKCMAEEKRV
jgi:hypothetical protein